MAEAILSSAMGWTLAFTANLWYYNRHNGIYCLIKDWWAKDPTTKKQGRKIEFRTLK